MSAATFSEKRFIECYQWEHLQNPLMHYILRFLAADQILAKYPFVAGVRNLIGFGIRIRLKSVFLGNQNLNRNSNDQTKGIWIRFEIGMLGVEFVSESKILRLDSHSSKT